jgi:hypothetical protein
MFLSQATIYICSVHRGTFIQATVYICFIHGGTFLKGSRPSTETYIFIHFIALCFCLLSSYMCYCYILRYRENRWDITYTLPNSHHRERNGVLSWPPRFVERMRRHIRESCYCLWPKRQGWSWHPHPSQLATTSTRCPYLREMNHTGTSGSRDPSAVGRSSTNFITIVPKLKITMMVISHAVEH